MNTDEKYVVPETKNGSRLGKGVANEEWVTKRRELPKWDWTVL
jgi:hypothetical protein